MQTGLSNQRSNCQHSLDHRESKGIPEITFPSASLTMLKPFTVWTTTNWKILKEMGLTDLLTFLVTSLYVDQNPKVRIRHRTPERFKVGKGELQGIHCHSGYLIYM